jgi:hypothetical protein
MSLLYGDQKYTGSQLNHEVLEKGVRSRIKLKE